MPGSFSRRDFHKLLLSTGVACVLPSAAPDACAAEPQSDSLDRLAESFAEPPAASRPHAYWMWMNGNVTRQGITLDLEAMQRCGIGGFYLYQDAVGIPRGPVDYGSEDWLMLMHHAIAEAGRLGLTAAIHNAPGYSGTGGPWITPEASMQELVWTEAFVEGGKDLEVLLPQAPARAGYYRDALVLAYPSLKGERKSMLGALQLATCNGAPLEPSRLRSHRREDRFHLEHQSDRAVGTLDLQFAEPFQAHAISVYRSPEAPIDPFDGPRDYPPVLTLMSSLDGMHYAQVCTIRCPALRSLNAPAAASFTAVSARFFQLRSSAPTWLIDVELHAGPRLAQWPGKANFTEHVSSRGMEESLPPELCIDPAKILDISEHTDLSGRLLWKAPPGRWTIVRLGHTTTEEVVGAAPESAIGLECDKFSKTAVELHFKKSLDPLFARLGPLTGNALAAVTIDSWEAGKGNWTPEFPACFLQICGYDLRPWILAMTGRVIGTVAQSERFLFDLRRTQAQLLAENYYGHFQSLCRAHGLKL